MEREQLSKGALSPGVCCQRSLQGDRVVGAGANGPRTIGTNGGPVVSLSAVASGTLVCRPMVAWPANAPILLLYATEV